jgi:ABC transporter substrate binding protein
VTQKNQTTLRVAGRDVSLSNLDKVCTARPQLRKKGKLGATWRVHALKTNYFKLPIDEIVPATVNEPTPLLGPVNPKSRRVAALWNRVGLGFKETQDAAKALSVPLHPIELREADEIDKAFAEMSKAHVDALLVVLSPLVTLHSKRIAELALKHRLPGMYPTRQFVEEGGIAAYGPLLSDLYHRAATYVDKILKGAKPMELPVEQPTKFEFIINLKAAKQIGLTIPPNVLARADKVIK